MSERVEHLREHAPKALAALFATSGTIHFLKPEVFTGIVPRFLPAPEALVYVSGAAELVCAAGLLTNKRWAAAASVALLLAVLPANVQMALDVTAQEGAASWQSAVVWGRLPLQIPLIWAALQARGEEPE